MSIEVTRVEAPASASPDSDAIISVAHYGLGPIGLAVAGMIRKRRSLRSIAAVDIDPALGGKDLGDLCGGPPVDVLVTGDEELPPAGQAGVAIHCTGSSLVHVAPQIQRLVGRGFNVISTCEELSYPWYEAAEVAGDLDRCARDAGVVVLGTGVNPGFAMDYLPLAFTGATDDPRSIEVHRVQNASERRLPLQRKVGAGLTREEFEERRAAGGLGHVGLRQSAEAIAAGLGWRLDRVEETLLPAIADDRVTAPIGVIEPGTVTGIDQTVAGFISDRAVITLRLEMAVGREDAGDTIRIDGAPPIEITVPGGLHGDVATASIVVNAIPRVLEGRPGLRVMSELPLIRHRS